MKKGFRHTLMMSVIGLCLSAPTWANEDLNASGTTKVDDYTLKGPVNYVTGVEPGDADGNVNVVVEIPKGSTGKWEVAEDGNIKWEFKKGKPRVVDYQGGYPANYGSVPKTAMPKSYGGDGETVDVIVLGEAIPRGTVVKVKLVAVLNLKEGDEFDAKLVAVTVGSPEAAATSIADLNAKFDGAVDKVSAWFTGYKGPDSGIVIESVGDGTAAMDILNVSAEAFGK